MLCLEECWREGFMAGERFIKHCPYGGNSLEARNWRNGWLEGAAKSIGLDYQDTPAIIESMPLAGHGHDTTAA